MNRHSPAEVWEPEGGMAVAALGCAEDGEECRVLAYCEELSIAFRPSTDSEVAAEHHDLTNEGFHSYFPVLLSLMVMLKYAQREDAAGNGLVSCVMLPDSSSCADENRKLGLFLLVAVGTASRYEPVSSIVSRLV